MNQAGLYFHVPFCQRKCPYCNFYSIPVTAEGLERYTDAVCRNLRAYSATIPVDTVYFGGGTPSLLSPAQIRRILETAAACFSLAQGAEITLEANPATVTKQQLLALGYAGVNRLSFGVQSLHAEELSQLHRLHTAEEAVETVRLAADCGFENISCDLMLALPQQTAASLAHTIHRLTQLPITHVSAYLLKVEPGTPFAEMEIQKQCPDSDQAADLYLEAVELLEQAGFGQYEISNFAKDGFQSRHNCKYWKCMPYLGIGPSAHSCWNGTRFFVPDSVTEFLSEPIQKTVVEDPAPCSREEQIMLKMRLTEGVPLAWLAEKEALVKQLIQAGLLRQRGESIAFTPKGFLVSNSILAELL